MGRVLKKLNRQGTAIVLVTHDTDFASKFCTGYMIMFNGSIVATGKREDILGEGIFYTTSINKLVRDKDKSVFTLEEALSRCSI